MHNLKDPHFKKESLKYKNPIPSRKYILSYIKEQQISKAELFKLLSLSENKSKAFSNRLSAMVRDKQLNYNLNGTYSIFDNTLLAGEVIANRRGFGFIKLSNNDNNSKDLRLNYKQMHSLFSGDKIKVRLLNNKLDVEVVEIISNAKNLIGLLNIKNNKIIINVYDNSIQRTIEIKKTKQKYPDNSMVLIDIIKRATADNNAKANIISVLGDSYDYNTQVKAALRRFDIPYNFNKNIIKKVEQLSDNLTKKDKNNRINLCEIPFITIDGEDSRDFDDAVFAVKDKNKFKLYVAIADVAHYVKQDDAIDLEAFNRGNSVYFTQSVVPMLPEKLSNNLCSLKPKVDRLVVICEMLISGKQVNYKFYNAIIKSHARLSYNEVDKIINNNLIVDKAIKQNIDCLFDLYKKLKNNRKMMGVIDFDRAESKIIFDDNNKIKSIVAIKRGVSHKIIEECMLIANQSSANFLNQLNKKNHTLYRVHPAPTIEKTITIRKFLGKIGVELSGGEKPTTMDFANVIKDSYNKIDDNLIKSMILMSMQQAFYTTDNIGHFGLAFENYVHFTSPIRRYADLITHRAIKSIIANNNYTNNNIKAISQHLSITERKADKITRDIDKWLKCEYMQTKINQTFTGVITKVSNYGLFVELADIFIEGFVSIRDLKDNYYIYDEVNMQLKGSTNNITYKLGNKIRIKIIAVNTDNRQISLLVYE